VDCYLPYFRQQVITCPLSSHLPFQSLFTVSSCRDQLLALSPFSGALRAPNPLYCMFLFSSLFIIQVFFYRAGGSVCLGGYAGSSQGWLWKYRMPFICSTVGLLDVSQAGLEPVSCGVEALLFSQYNVALRSFVGCRGLEC
jgi:hypothetical protein